jgi:hypothetical protein
MLGRSFERVQDFLIEQSQVREKPWNLLQRERPLFDCLIENTQEPSETVMEKCALCFPRIWNRESIAFDDNLVPGARIHLENERFACKRELDLLNG